MLREIDLLPIRSKARPPQSSRRPKFLSLQNYSDDAPTHCLETRIARALAETGFRELQDILVIARNGKVTLWGTVSTYFLKQLAQEITGHQPGVCHVVNGVHVGQLAETSPPCPLETT